MSRNQTLPAQRAKLQVGGGFGGSSERGAAKLLPNFCPSAGEIGSSDSLALMIPVPMPSKGTC